MAGILVQRRCSLEEGGIVKIVVLLWVGGSCVVEVEKGVSQVLKLINLFRVFSS